MRRKRNINFNYSYLRGFIRENFKTLEKYAEFLGISTTTLYERLNNKSPFTQDEIYKTANYSNKKKLSNEEIDLLFFTF